MEDERNYEYALKELMVRIAGLEARNRQLETTLTEVAQANLLPAIMQNGFDNMIAELRPLRDLTPTRASLPAPTAEAVDTMLAAMRGVALGSESLGIREVNVPFIGQPRAEVWQEPVAPNQQRFAGGIRS